MALADEIEELVRLKPGLTDLDLVRMLHDRAGYQQQVISTRRRLVAEGRAGFESQYGQPRSHQDRYLVRGYKNAQPVDPVPVFRPCLTTPSQGPLLATYACRCTKNMRAIAGRIMSGVEGAHNGIWRARPNPAMGHFSAAGLLGAKRGT